MESTPSQLFAAIFAARAATAAATSAGLGIAFHITVLRVFEVEQFLYNLLLLLAMATAALAYSHYLVWLSVVDALVRTFLIATSFNCGILASILVYRLLFHPLRKFPGDFGAKITAFYALAQASNSKYHKEVERLHEQHGDFIRTGRIKKFPHRLCGVDHGLKLNRSSRVGRYPQVGDSTVLWPRLGVSQVNMVLAKGYRS